MKFCIRLYSPQPGRVFPFLPTNICVPILYPIPPIRPIPPEETWEQIRTLATIVELAGSLPNQNPLREELHTSAIRALEEAVGELGDGVQIDMSEMDAEAS
jgi:hypothetical protein